jgi:hypothetical protein
VEDLTSWEELLGGHGHEVRLIPPQYLKPYVHTNRNDYIDGEAILKIPNDAELPGGGLLPVGLMIGHKIDQFAPC